MIDLTVYSEGPCSISVCVPKTFSKEDVERETNAMRPTGISSPWRVTEEMFHTGETNPCPCDVSPDAREHWLLNC